MLGWGADGRGAQEGAEREDVDREADEALEGQERVGRRADRWLGRPPSST